MSNPRNISHHNISRKRGHLNHSQDHLAEKLSGILKLPNPRSIEEIAESDFFK